MQNDKNQTQRQKIRQMTLNETKMRKNFNINWTNDKIETKTITQMTQSRPKMTKARNETIKKQTNNKMRQKEHKAATVLKCIKQ